MVNFETIKIRNNFYSGHKTSSYLGKLERKVNINQQDEVKIGAQVIYFGGPLMIMNYTFSSID